MAILSCRVDDALKESLEAEAMKKGISLSKYIKKSLKNGLVDTHISNTENNLSDSKVQIKKLAEISDEVINEVERKIKRLSEDVEKYNHATLLKKMYWILISVSILLGIISIPILLFSISFISGY